MRYFMTIIPPADLKPEDIPQGLGEAMGRWMEKSLAAGTLVSTAGLKPAKEARRLRGHSKKVAVTDGPFAEAKEVVGGYAVLEAPDLDAATALAGEFLQMHIDNGLTDIVLEVREIAGGRTTSGCRGRPGSTPVGRALRASLSRPSHLKSLRWSDFARGPARSPPPVSPSLSP